MSIMECDELRESITTRTRKHNSLILEHSIEAQFLSTMYMVMQLHSFHCLAKNLSGTV